MLNRDEADIFFPKNGSKWTQNQFFMRIFKNLLFFFIWSIMKFYFICYVLVQMPYVRKIWFLRLWTEVVSVNQIAGFFNQLYT